MDERLKELISKAVSRRTFLAGAGSAAAVTVVAGCGSSATPTPTPTPTPTTTATPAPTAAALTDADILTFALNLEYLEAEYYLRAATGSGLSATDSGNSTSTVTVPATTLIPNLTTAQANYIYEIAQNELDHVRFLRSALSAAGATVISRPEIDLMNSFSGAATLAGIPGGASFNPFASYEAFLVGAFVFEDVGVTAYAGAAALITNKAYLSAAASILAVEAYHAGEIRTLLIQDSVMNATTANGTVSPNNTYIGYANMISALRAEVGGGNETPITPLPPYSTTFNPKTYKPASSIVAANATNSVGFARTTDEVLHIVYATGGAAGVAGGGFFPSGLNGAISVTKA